MTRLLYALGALCARDRRRVAGLWVVAVVAVALIAKGVGAPTSDNLTLPGTGSTNAQDLLSDHLPNQANGTNPVVLKASSGTLATGANQRAVKATVHSLAQAPHVQSAVSPLTAGGAGALSKNGRIGYISVSLDLSPSELDKDEAEAVIDAEQPARDAGLKVATGGYLGQEVSKPETESSEVVGITAAVIILLFAFGTAAAMPLPIATAILGLVGGLGAIGLLGNVIEVPTVGPTLGIMLGLGVGIDYSLFIVTRHRGFLAEGHAAEEAAARAVATAGGAVLFAGSTVIIALCSLVVAGIPLVSALGYSAAIVVLIAVLAAITLLPALLATLGPRIESLRVPFVRQAPHDERPHGWARWARGVARVPWLAALAAVTVLLTLAIPVLQLELGQQDNGQLSKSTTVRQAYDLLSAGFGPGVNGPLLIGVDLKPPAHPDHKQLDQLKAQKQKQKQKQQQAVQQTTEQLIAEGVPQDQAQSEAEKQVAAQGPSAKKEKQTSEQEAFLKSPASDPRLVKLENRISKTHGVKEVSPAKVDRSGTPIRLVFHAAPTAEGWVGMPLSVGHSGLQPERRLDDPG